jgi:hypothetical protein
MHSHWGREIRSNKHLFYIFLNHFYFFQFWDTPTSLLGRGSYGVSRIPALLEFIEYFPSPMQIVFRGVRLPQRQPVAIKRMWRVNVRPDELEAMKCVRNGNLVALLDVYEEPLEEISYLVMELCGEQANRIILLQYM